MSYINDCGADFDFTRDRLPSFEQITRIKEITKH